MSGFFSVLYAASGEVFPPFAQDEKSLTPLRGALRFAQ